MTVVFLPVSGSVLYSKVIVSSWKFFSGLSIFVCLMVFSRVIKSACLFSRMFQFGSCFGLNNVLQAECVFWAWAMKSDNWWFEHVVVGACWV